jgi:hypothetical protein
VRTWPGAAVAATLTLASHALAVEPEAADATAVFNAGTADAERGRDAVAKSWAGRVEGESAVLRWRPGIVNIGGDLNRAISRGPYILQTTKDGVASFSVGFYQTVWVCDPDDMAWRVLLDGGASTLAKLSDRVAAEAWVVAQAMSDCAAGSSP